MHMITRVDPPTVSSSTKVTHQPVYLRSFKIPAPRAAVAPKVSQILTELGISYTRLVMPTRDNCLALESLLDATTALVDIKKVVDKVEHDIRLSEMRLGNRAGASQDADATKADSGGDGNAMEVDEVADGKSDEGRDQSVISVGRKQASTLAISLLSRSKAHVILESKIGIGVISGHHGYSVNANGYKTTKKKLMM